MNTSSRGWVIVNNNHPNTSNDMILSNTFRSTRKDCIASFVEFSGSSWRYWYRKYNFRCVKDEITITTLN